MGILGHTSPGCAGNIVIANHTVVASGVTNKALLCGDGIVWGGQFGCHNNLPLG